MLIVLIFVGAAMDAWNGWFIPLTAACRDGRSEKFFLTKTPQYTACTCGHYGLDKTC